ncbi:hypothetical protein EYF80_050245 [Liparis tanakae]|uniref:Uncharacterized protein n=1 Tax=Liparis tanakae TaxID=230148 RepID=A0A4Z2FFC0_9TELE|nr:hypothetical protein EYF80_050245 [Liparis tanakae]
MLQYCVQDNIPTGAWDAALLLPSNRTLHAGPPAVAVEVLVEDAEIHEQRHFLHFNFSLSMSVEPTSTENQNQDCTGRTRTGLHRENQNQDSTGRTRTRTPQGEPEPGLHRENQDQDSTVRPGSGRS